MEHDAGGYGARAASLDLHRGTQVGHVGDAQFGECDAAGVVESAQLAGPVQPSGPHTGGVGDIAEVPGAGESFVVKSVLRAHPPVTAAAMQQFVAAAGMGLGGEDDAAVAKVYARNAGLTLPGEK